MSREAEKPSQIEEELDSVDLYLEQTRKYPADGFNVEQEKFLFGCIKTGLPIDYLPQSYFFELVPKEQQGQFNNALADSQSIEQFIALCNLGLPLSFAKQTAAKFDDQSLLLDFIQAGNEGLEKAIKKFDFERKDYVRFSTYATTAIKREIWEFIGEVLHPISIANNIRTVLGKANKFRNTFFQEHGRLPNDDEAREELLRLGVSNSKIDTTFDSLRTGVVNKPEPLPTLRTDSDTSSESEEITLSDPNVNVEEGVLDKVFEEYFVARIASVLKPKQLSSLVLKEGLLGNSPLEIREIAEMEGITMQVISARLRAAHKTLSKKSRAIKKLLAA